MSIRTSTGSIVYDKDDNRSLYVVVGKSFRKNDHYILQDIGCSNRIELHESMFYYVCSEDYHGKVSVADIPKLSINDFAINDSIELIVPLLNSYRSYDTHSMNDSVIRLSGEKDMLGAVIKMLLCNVSNGMYALLPCIAQAFYNMEQARERDK